MTNSLLDFVMSLVRDPDAAARYAADPAGVIADAQLAGVTSADVNGLIPMVTDSMTSVGAGLPTADGNVWTSGAAAAAFDAFDAFDVHIPAQVSHVADAVITAPDQVLPDLEPLDTASSDHYSAVGSALSNMDALVDSHPDLGGIDAAPLDTALPDWPVEHHEVGPHGADHPGFDLF